MGCRATFPDRLLARTIGWAPAWLAAILILATAAKAGAFVQSIGESSQGIVELRWRDADMPIHYRISDQTSESLPNLVPGSDPISAVQGGFQAWEAVAGSTVRFQFDGLTPSSREGMDGQNIMIFGNTQLYSPGVLGLTLTTFAPAPGLVRTPAGVVFQAEFTGQLLDTDILFNVAIPFTTIGLPEGAWDLQSVATHEVGHLLGLDHSAIVSATMFPGTPANTTYRRDLDPDDMAAVETIYPESGPESPALTSGAIEGGVHETGGSPVMGAHLTAIDSQGIVRSGAVTKGDGRYALRGLPAGEYRVFAEPLDQPITPQEFLTFFQALARQGQPNTRFESRFLEGEIDPNQARRVLVSVGASSSVPDSLVAAEGGDVLNATHMGIIIREVSTTRIRARSSLLVEPDSSLQIAVFGPGIDSRSIISFSDPRMTASVNHELTTRFANFIHQNFGGGVVADLTIAGGVAPGPKAVFVSDGSHLTAYAGGLQVIASAGPVPPSLPTNPVDADGNGRFSFGEVLEALEGILGGATTLTVEEMASALGAYLRSP